MAAASRFVLPPGNWATVFACLCDSFPAISRERWRERFTLGLVLDADQQPLDIAQPHRVGSCVYYFREVPNEKPIPFFEKILHADEHLIVVDKPHFLPVTPAGEYVEQTVLARLIKRFSNSEIAPLHRIDRHTAGLVLFSAQRKTRALYQSLFREQTIDKYYEAVAPSLPQLQFPLIRTSRIVRGDPFFLSQEMDGEPNSKTLIDVIERSGDIWHYGLIPVTGKKHQLRVHMASLGAAIENDPFYPTVRIEAFDDYTKPLKLLARRLHFIDPLNGIERVFESELSLAL